MSDRKGPLTDYDLHLFGEGNYGFAYDKFGAHPETRKGVAGTRFAVWAPNAREVSLVGDFNGWNRETHRLDSVGSSGVWQGFAPGVKQGDCYKFFIRSNANGYEVEKSDPFGFAAELRPKTASVVWNIEDYTWSDTEWMASRGQYNGVDSAMSVYEVHLGSWRRTEDGRWLSYRELADQLVEYVRDLGFTHIELLPITEHPFDASWGYQTIGYFAPTSRFGTPQDFMYLVDRFHQAGVGVILDWVPAHFPKDGHGLSYFDGTHLYEHADPRKGEHQDWGTLIFNYGRHEVRSFLLASALFWLDKYHIDGLRVDAVASMLYLDYSRKAGEWVPNAHGGRENLEAIELLRRANQMIYERFPDCFTCAEESTAWPGVSRPTYLGGLGFGFKWNMGWMHDMLRFMSKEPVYRQYHHNDLTFGMLYASHENFILPFSHDEVVHGKGSMLGKMPGDGWQKFANLRALYGYMWCYPGKKLLFMGCEFGQGSEWNDAWQLDWHLMRFDFQRGLHRWLRDLNALLRSDPALHEVDYDWTGFQWIDCTDHLHSVISFYRKAKDPEDVVVCVCNFTPVPRMNYRIGLPIGGRWREALNSDAHAYGGSNLGNAGFIESRDEVCHGLPSCAELVLPPLATLILKPER